MNNSESGPSFFTTKQQTKAIIGALIQHSSLASAKFKHLVLPLSSVRLPRALKYGTCLRVLLNWGPEMAVS